MACLDCGGFGWVVKSEAATAYAGRYAYSALLDHEHYCETCPAGPALEAADKKKAATVAPVTTW